MAPAFAGAWAALAKHSQRSAHAASVSTFLSADQARRTVQELLDTSLQYCPRTYENDKHWGETKKVWAGVRIGHEGFKITTHRRWKEVKHGLQTKYKIAFPGDDKAPLPVHVDVRSVSPNLTDDASSAKGWKIDCYLITPLDFQARVERWNRGVKFYSVEILGKMKIGLRIDGQLDAYPDYAELPPAIVIDPAVQQAELTLMSLDVDRVSKIGGEVAEQWGELMEKVIRAVLLDDFNEGLAKKLNRAIDKKRDRLRLSISDWMKQINQA